MTWPSSQLLHKNTHRNIRNDVEHDDQDFVESNKAVHDPIELSLYGGEEYELLVTIKSRLWEKAKKALEHVGASLIKIGVVTKEKSLLLEMEGKTVSIDARGWEHFKTSKSDNYVES